MKNLIYILLFAAITLTACEDQEQDVAPDMQIEHADMNKDHGQVPGDRIPN